MPLCDYLNLASSQGPLYSGVAWGLDSCPGFTGSIEDSRYFQNKTGCS